MIKIERAASSRLATGQSFGGAALAAVERSGAGPGRSRGCPRSGRSAPAERTAGKTGVKAEESGLGRFTCALGFSRRQ